MSMSDSGHVSCGKNSQNVVSLQDPPGFFEQLDASTPQMACPKHRTFTFEEEVTSRWIFSSASWLLDWLKAYRN